MDDLGQVPEGGVAPPEAPHQHLERAEIALVRELRLEHVEPDLVRAWLVGVAAHELEPRLGVDEAADQPGTGDAVDVDAAAGHPGSPRLRCDGRRRFVRAGIRGGTQCALGGGQQRFHLVAAGRPEEIHRRHVLETPPEPREGGRGLLPAEGGPPTAGGP